MDYLELSKQFRDNIPDYLISLDDFDKCSDEVAWSRWVFVINYEQGNARLECFRKTEEGWKKSEFFSEAQVNYIEKDYVNHLDVVYEEFKMEQEEESYDIYNEHGFVNEADFWRWKGY